MLQPPGEKPFLELGVVKAGTAVVQAEGDGDFNFAASGDLYPPTEIAFRHDILKTSLIMLPVLRQHVNDRPICRLKRVSGNLGQTVISPQEVPR